MSLESLSAGEQQPKEDERFADKIVGALVSSELGHPEDYKTIVKQAAAEGKFAEIGEAMARFDNALLDTSKVDKQTEEEAKVDPTDFIDEVIGEASEEQEAEFMESYDATEEKLDKEVADAQKHHRDEILRHAVRVSGIFKPNRGDFDPNGHNQSEN